MTTPPLAKDMSYSMILEKNKDVVKGRLEPLNTTMPRRIHTWIKDDSVETCQNCSKTFTMFMRRHHCRLCGRIYCFECSDYRQVIPEEILSDESKQGTWNDYLTSYVKTIDLSKHRVCLDCNELIKRVNAVTKIINVFNILELDICELRKAGEVNRYWRYAANYCLSILRETQYKMPIDAYTELERTMLWKNAEYMAGHSKYLISLLKICKSEQELKRVNKLLERKKRMPCRMMMCTRNCREKIQSVDSINLLAFSFKQMGNYNILKKIALRYLICSDEEMRCYLPLLVYNIRNDSGMVMEFLIQRCFRNFELLNSLYWELMMYPKEEFHEDIYAAMLEKLKKMLSDGQHNAKFLKLLEGYSFIDVIRKIGTAICDEGKTYEEVKNIFTLNCEMVYPLRPEQIITKICLDDIKVKHSNSKPIIIPCETTEKSRTKLMFKKEDLRKDQIIINLISIAKLLIEREEGLDLEILTYNVLPTSKNSGIIEIIDDAETVYYIQKKLQTSILNYILEKNGDLKIKEVRKRFIKSTAAYCVITYLLGVGDRHLDNIMVTKEGRMFHIDFGYILGKDPKFNDPSIRITPEIIEAIGGFSSENYIYFKEICTRIYNCLRRNINIFMNMLLLIPHISDIEITEEEIKQQIMKRFIPGENDVNATFHLVKKLEEDSYTDRIMDFCHYHSKEKTISSATDRLSSALAGLWGYVTKQ